MSLIPPAIRDERFSAMEQLINEISEQIRAINLLIYDIDNVDSSALPHLGEQFNVMGLRGWFLADTDFKKRNLIKNAIELHRTAGTPYAIRLALETLGYTEVVITENPETGATARFYDATFNYDGSQSYGGTFRGTFIVDLNVGGILSDQERDLIIALINEWKNTRSHLLELRTTQSLRYNSRALYNNEWNYGGDPIA